MEQVPTHLQTVSLPPAGSLSHGLRRASSLPEGAIGADLQIVRRLPPGIVVLRKASEKYLPPGGRWLGAQPQDGGSQRAANQFDHQRWNLPRIKIQSAPSQESSRYNGHRVSAIMSKYQPICKPELHRPQAPSGTCGASSLPEGAMGCVPFHMGLCF